VVAAAAGVLAVGAPADAGPLPTYIQGDHHSPAVVMLAAQALRSYDQLAFVGDRESYLRYVDLRDDAADAVAGELGLPRRDLRQAWARADTPHQVAVLAALTQLGVAYQFATSTEGVGFDCSGLTAYAWGRAGVTLARQSGSQIGAAAPRDSLSAVAGDLIQYPGHVMMYLGVDQAIVHASNHETDVELSVVDRDSLNWGDPTA